MPKGYNVLPCMKQPKAKNKNNIVLPHIIRLEAVLAFLSVSFGSVAMEAQGIAKNGQKIRARKPSSASWKKALKRPIPMRYKVTVRIIRRESIILNFRC